MGTFSNWRRRRSESLVSYISQLFFWMSGSGWTWRLSPVRFKHIASNDAFAQVHCSRSAQGHSRKPVKLDAAVGLFLLKMDAKRLAESFLLFKSWKLTSTCTAYMKPHWIKARACTDYMNAGPHETFGSFKHLQKNMDMDVHINGHLFQTCKQKHLRVLNSYHEEQVGDPSWLPKTEVTYIICSLWVTR